MMDKPKHPCTADCPMRNATCHTSKSNCQAWHEYQEQYNQYMEEHTAERIKANDVSAAMLQTRGRFSRMNLRDQKRGRMTYGVS